MNATTEHPFQKRGLGLAPFRMVDFYEDRGPKTICTKDGVTHQVGSPGQAMGTCDYCGTGIAYICVIKSADGKEFKVGTDCVEKTDPAAHAEAKIARKRHDWAKADAAARTARKLELDAQRARNGGKTDAEIEQIARDEAELARREQVQARLDAEAAAHEAAAPCPAGRVEIIGTVIALKWKESQFGGALKMLVRADAGYKVWGTVPNSLPFNVDSGRGERVKFTATVEPSNDDPKFGFFKRPTKAEQLTGTTVALVDDVDAGDNCTGSFP